MSLKSFIQHPEVRERLKVLRPKLSRQIGAPIQAHPRTKHWTLVGTAFDYLLRFELQRRVPEVVQRAWVAEKALTLVVSDDLLEGRGKSLDESIAKTGQDREEIACGIERILGSAKRTLSRYLEMQQPARSDQIQLAEHAIGLAKLDLVCRAGLVDYIFDDPDPEDAEDLADLLAIVPYDQFVNGQQLYFNPTFGESSRLVGGADADLIIGDLLVDLKTTKKSGMDPGSLDQILGYFLLARNQRAIDPSFPEINHLGLYFCRQGKLWTLSASDWTTQPGFQETEKWFFSKATELKIGFHVTIAPKDDNH